MRVIFRQFVQHTGEGCEDPSVAARPEVLAAGSCCVLGIDVAAVAVIESLFLIPHQVCAPSPVFVHLLEVEWVAGDEVELCHDGHDHIQAVHPPEVTALVGAHLVLHHLPGTCYLLFAAQQVVEVGIDLETYLVIAEEDVVRRLTVAELPAALVRACLSPVAVVFSPGHGVVEELVLARRLVGFHVAGVVNGAVPEMVAMRRVGLLPVEVGLVDEGDYVVLLGQFVLPGSEGQRMVHLRLETLQRVEPVLVAGEVALWKCAPAAAEVVGQFRAGHVVHADAEVMVDDFGCSGGGGYVASLVETGSGAADGAFALVLCPTCQACRLGIAHAFRLHSRHVGVLVQRHRQTHRLAGASLHGGIADGGLVEQAAC